MIDECRSARVQLGIAYRCRFEPHHVACARLARERTFGEPRIIQAGFGFRIGNPDQWRLRRALSGGGALMDVGIYALQTARMMTGLEAVRVSAVETKTDPQKFAEVDESITFQLTFPGNIVANCTTTYAVNGVNGFTVYAERGSFGMQPAYNYTNNRAFRSDRVSVDFGSPDQFALEMDDFADCILTGRQTIVPGEEGLRDVRYMMRIYEAARTGATVEL
jgi:predicted dehydrogenase